MCYLHGGWLSDITSCIMNFLNFAYNTYYAKISCRVGKGNRGDDNMTTVRGVPKLSLFQVLTASDVAYSFSDQMKTSTSPVNFIQN